MNDLEHGRIDEVHKSSADIDPSTGGVSFEEYNM
jgi:hypothetical protein